MKNYYVVTMQRIVKTSRKPASTPFADAGFSFILPCNDVGDKRYFDPYDTTDCSAQCAPTILKIFEICFTALHHLHILLYNLHNEFQRKHCPHIFLANSLPYFPNSFLHFPAPVQTRLQIRNHKF